MNDQSFTTGEPQENPNAENAFPQAANMAVMPKENKLGQAEDLYQRFNLPCDQKTFERKIATADPSQLAVFVSAVAMQAHAFDAGCQERLLGNLLAIVKFKPDMFDDPARATRVDNLLKLIMHPENNPACQQLAVELQQHMITRKEELAALQAKYPPAVIRIEDENEITLKSKSGIIPRYTPPQPARPIL